MGLRGLAPSEPPREGSQPHGVTTARGGRSRVPTPAPTCPSGHRIHYPGGSEEADTQLQPHTRKCRRGSHLPPGDRVGWGQARGPGRDLRARIPGKVRTAGAWGVGLANWGPPPSLDPHVLCQEFEGSAAEAVRSPSPTALSTTITALAWPESPEYLLGSTRQQTW